MGCPSANDYKLMMDRYNVSGVSGDGYDGDFDALKKKRKGGHRHGKPKDDCSRLENEDKPHCTFKKKPRYYSKHSPSRKNGPLSPLGYTQFYMPNVDDQSDGPPTWVVEYTTYKVNHLLPGNSSQPTPIPVHLLPGYSADIMSDTLEEENEDLVMRKVVFEAEMAKITPWKMRDLTIGSYVKLARKLVVERKMWSKFSEFM